MNIETIWNKIKLHEGEVFYKIRGGEYTYTVDGDVIIIDGIKAGRITKNTLAKVLQIPNPTPKDLVGFWASSYIYGIITDKRIKGF